MPLAEKVERSGLDLSGRTRPTLAMLPRGNWIRHYYYDFPALLSGGIDQLVDYGVSQFSRAAGIASVRGVIDSFSRLIPAAACRRSISLPRHPGHPTSFTSLMGFYGRDPASGNPLRGLEVIDGLARRPPAAGAGARGRTAGHLYRAADWSLFTQSGGTDRPAFGERRPGSGREPVAPLSGRSLRGPAFANRAALHGRTADRAGRAVQLAGIGTCLAVSMAGL